MTHLEGTGRSDAADVDRRGQVVGAATADDGGVLRAVTWTTSR